MLKHFAFTPSIDEHGDSETLISQLNITETYNNFSSEYTLTNTDSFSEDLSLTIQAGMAFIGFIGNIITFVTLKRSSFMFGGTALRLLKNQAVADAIVCFLGSIFVLQPPMWKTGINVTLDLLICQVSHLLNTVSYVILN